MIAFVTGANGCIGRALIARLSAPDSGFHEVRALVRRPAFGLAEGVEQIVGDLDDLDALHTGCRGADVVFHAAAKVHDAQATPEECHRVNVLGTGRLLDACDPDRPPRLLHFSTVAVYGESTPAEGLRETAPVRPATPYARSKAAAEELIDTWADSVGAVAVSLRVATVYGPYDRGNLLRMLDAIERGRFVLIGGGRNRKSLVAVDNVAAAAAAVARAGSALVAGQRIVVADPEPYPLRTIATAMCRALGDARRPPSVPLSLARLLSRLLGPRSPMTVDQAQRLAAHTVYLPGQLTRIASYRPVTDLDAGLSDVVRWRRSGI
jgi:nucleoside-diphosphate-sugar epimerase